MNTFACIDIGGTAIKYGVIQADGTVLESFETPTEAYKGGPALAEKVRNLVKELLAIDPSCQGIAISSAGVVDSNKAEIIHASSAIPHYIGVNYRDVLAEFGLPVEMENDVNCAGLCETTYGPAKDSKSSLMLTIGTGIGGCYIQNGALLNGNCFSACEVGYMPLEGGAFQDQASTTALVQDMANRKDEAFEDWNGRKIFAAAEQGDLDALAALGTLCENLGRGIAAICFVLNPETVVLGGGIMAREDVLREGIENSFARHSIPLIARTTKFEFASALNAAGMKGALVHFLHRHPDLA